MGTTNVQGKNYDDEIRSISDQLSGSVKSVNQKTGEEIILSSSDIMHVDENSIVKPISETIGELKNSVADGKTTVANAISAKGILATGLETFASLAAKISQIVQGSGNATEADVLEGKTFSNSSKTNATGAMPNVGSVSNVMTTNNQEYTVPEGYHDGTGKVHCKPTNLVAGNIRSGATVGGVAGSFQGPSGTAIASDVIAGKTFSNSSGTNINGTMVNRGAINTTLTSNNQSYAIPSGYHNGSGRVYCKPSNLVAGNIRKGVTVGGVVGTYGGDDLSIAGFYETDPLDKIPRSINLSRAPKYLVDNGSTENTSLYKLTDSNFGIGTTINLSAFGKPATSNIKYTLKRVSETRMEWTSISNTRGHLTILY